MQMHREQYLHGTGCRQINATEKVRHPVVLEDVVDRTSRIFPVGERRRILVVDTVTTAVPVVLITWTRTGAPSHTLVIFQIAVVP